MSFDMFFFNVTATTGMYTYWHTRSLHDSLPNYPAVADAEKQPDGMRNDDPDEGDQTGDRHCGGGAQSGGEHHPDPHPRGVDAHRGSLLIIDRKRTRLNSSH